MSLCIVAQTKDGVSYKQGSVTFNLSFTTHKLKADGWYTVTTYNGVKVIYIMEPQ